MMNKKLGHFNPEILERFRSMVGGDISPTESKVDKKQVLSAIDEATRQGLSQAEIRQAYSKVKSEHGVIDTWEKLGYFRKELESLLKRGDSENDFFTLRDVEYLVGKLKPLHMTNQKKVCKGTGLGYINADALQKFRENTSQQRACQKPDGTIYRIPFSRECQQGIEVPNKPDEDKDKNQTRSKGRGRRSPGSSGRRSSIIQNLAGKLGGGAGRLTVKKIGGS